MADYINKIICGDSLEVMRDLASDSVDLVLTDPPYGYSFMGKDWDKAVPSVDIWKECLRVLKPGAFCCVMSAPRSDVQMNMIRNLSEAGFRLDFTPIYWTYASGFPKAGNIGKLVDKRRWGAKVDEIRHYLRDVIKASTITNQAIKQHLGYDHKSGVVSNWTVTDSGASVPSGKDWLKLKEILPLDNRYDDLILEVEREELGRQKMTIGIGGSSERMGAEKIINEATSPQAKALDGSYAGFQPKPAVEVIIVAMKPLSEKTFVDQALKNGKGITWLDDCRVPTESGADLNGGGYRGVRDNFNGTSFNIPGTGKEFVEPKGRFPANLLVADDVLNDGVERKSTGGINTNGHAGKIRMGRTSGQGSNAGGLGDSGSYSRYFDLDRWWINLSDTSSTLLWASTLPFLIVPKASKSEKNEGLEGWPQTEGAISRGEMESVRWPDGSMKLRKTPQPTRANHHPTVKPLKLMSYLIVLFSREGDIILDPFLGSGTTCVSAKNLNRNYIGIEINPDYVKIAQDRLKQEVLL